MEASQRENVALCAAVRLRGSYAEDPEPALESCVRKLPLASAAVRQASRIHQCAVDIFAGQRLVSIGVVPPDFRSLWGLGIRRFFAARQNCCTVRS